VSDEAIERARTYPAIPLWVAGYTLRERKSLGNECPRCKARTGKPCLKQTATNNYWDLHLCAHPHKERMDLMRENERDQGATWARPW
jgi:hypothetical protein